MNDQIMPISKADAHELTKYLTLGRDYFLFGDPNNPQRIFDLELSDWNRVPVHLHHLKARMKSGIKEASA